MSCRVLGRSVEYSLWRPVLTYLKSKGFSKVKASFTPTQKNLQVTNFYDDLGLTPGSKEVDGSVRYFADIDEVVAKIPKHAIEVLIDF
jgi:predicted enzyme involved in methoxymalonyl-ACP biosynthesis